MFIILDSLKYICFFLKILRSKKPLVNSRRQNFDILEKEEENPLKICVNYID